MYDGIGRLTGETVTTGTTISVSDTYSYDLRGNRTSKTGIGTTTQYIYDLNNRLLSTTEETADTSRMTRYYYDKNGNTISKATTEVAPSTGDAQYTMSDTANSYVTFYDYNRYNRLTSAETDGVVSRYTYNADNLRATKTAGNVTTEYVWDGQNLAAETKQGTTEAYTYDMTGVHTKKQEDEVTSYLKDYHGNVIGTADSTGRLDYDAYGNQLQGDAPDPFGYCGEYYDSETGLIYLRARYYDPTTGRFINEDTIKDGLNWYMYCGNNPVMYVDPTGKIREPGYVNGVWCEDPDAYEFGKNSIFYDSLTTLGNMWQARPDNRKDIEELANKVRTFSKQTTISAKIALVQKKAPKSANATDIIIMAGDSDKALMASSDMKTAQKYADDLYGKDYDGSQHNALKHTMWSALMTKRFGAEYAKMIGNAHEFGAKENLNMDKNQQELMNMDLWNNAQGRSLGNNFVKSHWYGNYNYELAWEIVKMINNKKIWVVNWVD